MTTYTGYVETWNDECARAAEGALRAAGVVFTRGGLNYPRLDVEAISAGQYAAVIDALHEAGEAGIDWNFPLD
jgi:hypothetical protein